MDDIEWAERRICDDQLRDSNGNICYSKNTYLLSESNEQQLIKTIFGVAMRLYDSKDCHKDFKDREELGEWIRMNLEMSGYKTKAIGCAWAVLMEIDKTGN